MHSRQVLYHYYFPACFFLSNGGLCLSSSLRNKDSWVYRLRPVNVSTWDTEARWSQVQGRHGWRSWTTSESQQNMTQNFYNDCCIYLLFWTPMTKKCKDDSDKDELTLSSKRVNTNLFLPRALPGISIYEHWYEDECQSPPVLKYNNEIWGWRGVWVGSSAHCSVQGREFGSQHPY